MGRLRTFKYVIDLPGRSRCRPRHSHQTRLPRHHVARQRLCLRATTDYWVNAMDGQPFFMVNQAVDPGMLEVIEREILPQLSARVPQQPTAQQLHETPRLHRFTLVFDREGYSPDFLQRMNKQRVACVTYHKFQGPDWADKEFTAWPVSLQGGAVVSMELPERGTRLSNGLWVREIRKRTEILIESQVAQCCGPHLDEPERDVTNLEQ